MSDVKPDSAGAKLSAMPGLVSTEAPFSAAHTTGQSAAAAGRGVCVGLVHIVLCCTDHMLLPKKSAVQ